jgi:hypothetical protein
MKRLILPLLAMLAVIVVWLAVRYRTVPTEPDPMGEFWNEFQLAFCTSRLDLHHEVNVEQIVERKRRALHT